VTRWIIQKEGSVGYEKTWYIDSKGHFEYVSRYEELTSERNWWIGKWRGGSRRQSKVKLCTKMETEPEIERGKVKQN